MALNNQLGSMTLGATAQGSYWAMRALHPCDETRGGGAPIPDQSETESANLEYRVDSISAAADSTQNWDLQLVFLPFAELPIAQRTRVSGAGEWSDWYGFAPNGSPIQPGYLTLGHGNDIEDPPYVAPFNHKNPVLYSDTTGFRAPYRGITCILNASSLSNQGYITAGQWSNTPELDQATLNISSAANPGGPLYQTYFVKDVPEDPADIITRCPEAGQWEARKGIYMPLRFPNPAHQYTTPIAYSQVGPAQEPFTFGIPIQIQRTNVALNDYVYKLNEGVNQEVWTVSGTVNLNLGTVIFSGLDPRATVVTKCRSGLELIPNKGTMASEFIKTSPIIDDTAIKAVQAISSKLPVVYESKFNSLGAIVPAIFSVAKHILPVVAPWLMGKIRGLFGRGGGTVKTAPPTSRYIEEDLD